MTAGVNNRGSTKRRSLFAALGALGVLLLLSVGVFTLLERSRADGEQTSDATIGGPFRLVDTRNRAVTDRDFRGHYLLVYFGYTSCPDVCPTTLSAVVKAMSLLGARADDVQTVFISVDPDHDTPPVLGRFLAAFSPRFIGLTGDKQALQEAEKAYHVIVRFGPDGIDHSAVLYLMAPNGAFLAPLPADSSAPTIAADLNHYLG